MTVAVATVSVAHVFNAYSILPLSASFLFADPYLCTDIYWSVFSILVSKVISIEELN